MMLKALLIVLLLILVAEPKGLKRQAKPGPGGKPGPQPKPAPRNNINVNVGYEVTMPDGNTGMGVQFYPEVVAVQAGDYLTFTLQSDMEPHTVTFGSGTDSFFGGAFVDAQDGLVPFSWGLALGPPGAAGPVGFTGFGISQSVIINTPNFNYVFDGVNVTSSAWLLPGFAPSWTVQINAPPGVYSYRCGLHPLMKGYVVVVQQPGDRDNQASANQRANAQIQDTLLGLEVQYALTYTYLTTARDPSTPAGEYVVVMGAGDGLNNIYGFMPPTLTVSESATGGNVTVRFVNRDPFTPHSVEQKVGGTAPPVDVVSPQPFVIQQGVYFLTDYVMPLLYGSPFTLSPLNYRDIQFQFDTTGTYNLNCGIHDFMLFTLTINA